MPGIVDALMLLAGPVGRGGAAAKVGLKAARGAGKAASRVGKFAVKHPIQTGLTGLNLWGAYEGGQSLSDALFGTEFQRTRGPDMGADALMAGGFSGAAGVDFARETAIYNALSKMGGYGAGPGFLSDDVFAQEVLMRNQVRLGKISERMQEHPTSILDVAESMGLMGGYSG